MQSREAVLNVFKIIISESIVRELQNLLYTFKCLQNFKKFFKLLKDWNQENIQKLLEKHFNISNPLER